MLERTFSNVAEASKRNIDGLNSILGQLKNAKFGVNGFKGVYAHLEEAAAVGWDNVDKLDSIVAPGRLDRPDILLKNGVEIEVKNVGLEVAQLSARDIRQLRAKVKAALLGTGIPLDKVADANSAAVVAGQFARIRYRVRGGSPQLKANFDRQLAEILAEYKLSGVKLSFELSNARVPF